MGRPKNTLDRIKSKYVRKAIGGCWIWTGDTSNRGYGVVGYNYESWMAHRLFAWLYGMDVSGKLVCHKCDNPLCVNPKHLFIGTQKDNVRDMYSKGRQREAAGENSGTAKLTDEKVRMLRGISTEYTQCQLAEIFGISQCQVNRILHRKSWKHI